MWGSCDQLAGDGVLLARIGPDPTTSTDPATIPATRRSMPMHPGLPVARRRDVEPREVVRYEIPVPGMRVLVYRRPSALRPTRNGPHPNDPPTPDLLRLTRNGPRLIERLKIQPMEGFPSNGTRCVLPARCSRG